MAVLNSGAVRLALAALVTSAHAAAAAGGAASLEYAVKATYLYKLAPFVQWPAAAFSRPGAPIVICIAGQDPFGPVLDDVVRGQRVDGHPFVVRRVRVVTRGMGCHILYVGRSADQDAAAALKAVEGEPVLTVTDGANSGGMIEFELVGGRVRFDADEAAAEASGVPISSKLLELALSVRRPGQ